MLKSIISVYDKKSGVYLDPVIVPTVAQFKRTMFEMLLRDPNHPFRLFGEDYVAFDYGCYDTDEGIFELEPTMKPVLNFHELVSSPEFEKALAMVIQDRDVEDRGGVTDE